MQAELSRGHVGAARGDGAHHVQCPETASDGEIGVGDVDPLLFRLHPVAQDTEGLDVRDAPLEPVRVGKDDRALGAVDLDDAVTLERGVEAQQALRLLSRRERGRDLNRRGHLDGESLTRARSGVDLALRTGLRTDGRDPVDGAEQADQGREVVGTHVEQRARAVGEQEARVRMPQVGALRLEGGLGEERPTDQALLDGAASGLESRAEQGVGGRPHAHARGLGLLQQQRGGIPVQPQRLLGPDMLAGSHCGAGDVDVCGGDREVHHEVHVGMREHVFGAPVARDAVLLGLRAGALEIQVAEDQHLGVGEGAQILEVGVADDADPDDADADRAHRTNPPSVRNARLAAMSSNTSPGAWSYSMTAYSRPCAARSASARGTSAVPA